MAQLEIHGDTPHILHIGGRAADARRIHDALAGANHPRYDVEHAGTLSEGFACLGADRAWAILLDLDVPDDPGVPGLARLVRAAGHTPVLAIGGRDDDELARDVVRAGAFGFFLTRHLDGYWLPRLLNQAREWKRSELAFKAQTERFEVTLNAIGNALLSTDTSGRLTYLNSIAEAMTGWPSAEAIGRPLSDVLRIVDSTTREPVASLPERVRPERRAPNLVVSCLLIRRDGWEAAIEHSAVSIRDRTGAVTGTAIVLHDTSAARAMSARMSHLASHDPLTGLPNRLLLSDRLERALAMARRHHGQLAVLYLDIDHFKHINDALGHTLGDELLKAVGRDVTMCVRSSDTVSRQGGDEFVVVLAELERGEDAGVGANKILVALARPHEINGHQLHITVSAGISVYPADGEDAETLLKHADMALYDAKAQGRDCYRFFQPDLHSRAVERQSVETGLHRALDRGEFELLYQAKINLKSGVVVGAEALIRWRHPTRGLVEPAQFVTIAEACGLITPIGRWVVLEACRQARAWQADGLRPIPVSVNISAVEFRSPGFVPHIVEALEQTGLDPHYLEIELTESVLMANVETTNALLRALKALGVQLAIDDFGTGWSSLSYLRHFPVDVLKIDRSFVQEITANSTGASIVSAVISMGKSLRHRVVAEGVETHDQLAFLQAQDCDEGQGYYFGRPIVAPQFALEFETTRPESRADQGSKTG